MIDAIAHEGHDVALFIEVRGVRLGRFDYDLYFEDKGSARAGDEVLTQDGITVVVPSASRASLRGARLEHQGGGLVLVNPNQPVTAVPASVLDAGVDGPIGSRIRELLDSSVNPRIAAHGGRADLVAVDEAAGVAYIELSGGCQGCAMSQVTLAQGIDRTLRDAIAALERVVDVTDHATGANPFY